MNRASPQGAGGVRVVGGGRRGHRPAASAHDNAAGTALLDQAAERCGMRLEKALVDQGFKDEVLIHGALLDIDVEVAFNQHPGRAFRAREMHELLGMPTDEATVNVTRSRLGRLVRQGFLTQPGRGRYQKRT